MAAAADNNKEMAADRDADIEAVRNNIGLNFVPELELGFALECCSLRSAH